MLSPAQSGAVLTNNLLMFGYLSSPLLSPLHSSNSSGWLIDIVQHGLDSPPLQCDSQIYQKCGPSQQKLAELRWNINRESSDIV